jgi:putative resolvase
MTDKLLSIGQATRYLNISKATINRWQAKGLLKPVYTPGGQRRYLEANLREVMGLPELEAAVSQNRAVVYARVSTRQQAARGNLQRQKERLVAHAVDQHYQVAAVLTEVASGLNENRPQLRKALQMLADGKANILLVAHRDHLARFGYDYLAWTVATLKGRLEVVDSAPEKAPNEELVEDLVAIMTSFSARIYGKRGGKRVAQAVAKTLKESLP